LERLTKSQVENILFALRAAGCLDGLAWTQEEVIANVRPEHLDHLFHALRVEGSLGQLSSQQVDNLMYALRSAGRLGDYACTRGATYNNAGLITFHNSDFLNDPLFRESYRLGKATDSWGGLEIEWRVYVVCWAAAWAKHLPGDFVECGVNR